MSKIPPAPKQGSGLHNWLLAKSRQLLCNGYSPEIVVSELLEATANSGRTTQDIETEITNAITGAIGYLEDHPNNIVHLPRTNTRRDPLAFEYKGNRTDKRKPRIPYNHVLRRDVLASEKISISEGEGVKYFTYRKLFAGINFNIAACREVGKGYAVQSLVQWKYMTNFPRMGYVVPSYFSETGCTRSDLNVGERLYVVVEFDSGSPYSQFALHHYLGRTNPAFPLVMLVWSGNKSIHGWYASYGNSERRVRTFQRRASELGADQTCVSPSAWIRMPNGTNYKYKTRQEVLYFNVTNIELQNQLVRREIL